MSAPVHAPAADPDILRRRVAHQLFQKFAFASFVVWTASCFLIFITFAAGNSRPVFPAMLSMTAPLIPAALIWLAYRPLVSWQVKRRLATGQAGPTGHAGPANAASGSASQAGES